MPKSVRLDASNDKPDLRLPRWIKPEFSHPQRLEPNKEKRIGQVLRRMVLAFTYSPPPEADNQETPSEQGFPHSQRFEADQETRCTWTWSPWSRHLSKGERTLAYFTFKNAKFGGTLHIPFFDESGSSYGDWDLTLAIK